MRGTSSHAKVYLAVFVLAAPVVVAASFTSVFQERYPLYEVSRGAAGILVVPVAPYTMLHFVKPAVEALAAIVGGVVMGALSYRSRSISWGVGLHVAVASLMDVSSLAPKGVL